MNYSRAGITSSAGAILSAVFLGALLVGCSVPQRLDDPRASKTVAYAPGVPNFDMEAIATARDGTTGVDVFLGVPYLSFVFEPDSS